MSEPDVEYDGENIDLQLSREQCVFVYETYLKGILTDKEEALLLRNVLQKMSDFKQKYAVPDPDSDKTVYALYLKSGAKGPKLSEDEIAEVSYLIWIHAAIDKAMDEKLGAKKDK